MAKATKKKAARAGALFETYLAKADEKIARKAAATSSPFTIEVRFLGGLTQNQKAAFKLAADRWCKIIIGDLPSVMVEGEVIDDVLILAKGELIDGPGRVLGQAGPTHLRPASAGAAGHLPAKGTMTFDTADLAEMERIGTLNDVITHEMGHVLGIGTIWHFKNLLQRSGTRNPVFTGQAAMEAYGRLKGNRKPSKVPVENKGGPGTQDSHWRETIFVNELMSGFIASAGNPISRVTVGSLGDMGYEVDLEAAEPYTLPNLFALAEKGLLLEHTSPFEMGVVLPVIPVELPEESLRP
jgi:hypothetical protein